MFPVPGARFFPKHLPILLAQSRQCRPTQVLDFHQYRSVHKCWFLSVAVNHSHMNALYCPTGKATTPYLPLALCRPPESWICSGGRRRARSTSMKNITINRRNPGLARISHTGCLGWEKRAWKASPEPFFGLTKKTMVGLGYGRRFADASGTLCGDYGAVAAH